MVALSIMIEGQNGLTWPHWKRIVSEVEDLGFAGLFRSDHFTNARPPDKDSLEMVVSLTYLADHTQRIHFGPLVAPISFRDPRMLARQAVGDCGRAQVTHGMLKAQKTGGEPRQQKGKQQRGQQCENGR